MRHNMPPNFNGRSRKRRGIAGTESIPVNLSVGPGIPTGGGGGGGGGPGEGGGAHGPGIPTGGGSDRLRELGPTARARRGQPESSIADGVMPRPRISSILHRTSRQRIEPAYFHQISVAAPTITSGEQAWYGLRRIDARRDLGGDAVLMGVRYVMKPSDSAAAGITGVATPLAWGDAQGLSAAIVVGKRLPIQLGVWSSYAAHVPGIDAGGTAAAHTINSASVRPAEYLSWKSFPTGTWSDTKPEDKESYDDFGGECMEIRQGETVDVALVMRGSYVSGQTGTIVGLADVRLLFALAETNSHLRG